MSLNLPIYESEQALEKLSALHAPRQALDSEVSATVSNVIAAVRDKGDTALKEFTQKFSKEVPESFLLTKSQIQQAIDSVSPEAKQVIDAAAENIRIFAEATLAAIQPVHLNRQGFEVGLDWKPVERVGCYVPGGRYPLPSTALMTAITAHVAGVPNISLTCPALKNEVIYAGSKAGVSRFYQLGGAQAVAALAYGTESVPKVDKIFG
ncbi:MAG: histidinol dehydrogenase, partial [Vampirovibrio sp.]|nr:histidinol dehydrogenase [Vampirovibrio sp.]